MSMKRLTLPFLQQVMRISSVLLLIATGLLGGLAWPSSPGEQFMANQRRWAARPFANYRISVQVERLNTICHQEIETRGDLPDRVLIDTCSTSWLSSLTVTRLFEVGQRIEHSSLSRCYPSDQICTCERVLIHELTYDPDLGYPQIMRYRRQVRINWMHIDFWLRLLETHELPNCGSPFRNVNITVTSLTPLP